MTEILKPEKDGFNTIFKSDTWQIASIKYSKEYSKENFKSMKRHLTSDEIFVLVKGSATLYTVEEGKLITTEVEKEKVYCVCKNTWHYLVVSKDALLIVTEDSDMKPEDSETEDLECLVQK